MEILVYFLNVNIASGVVYFYINTPKIMIFFFFYSIQELDIQITFSHKSWFTSSKC